MPDHIETHMVTARVAHRCWLCRWPIQPETTYIRQTLRDGGIYTNKFHVDCHAQGLKWLAETWGPDPLDWATAQDVIWSEDCPTAKKLQALCNSHRPKTPAESWPATEEI